VTNLLQNYASTSKFPYVAKWNGNVAIDYEYENQSFGKPIAHLDYSFMSKRYFGISDLPNQNPLNESIASPGHGTVNARIGLADIAIRGATAEVDLWMDNITGQFYRVAGFDGGSLGVAGDVFSPPRTGGIDLKVKF
jgi:iron complex outermembrane receptor protein